MTEAEYLNQQVQELNQCQAWANEYSRIKGKSKSHWLKVGKEISFQRSVLYWVEIIRRDGGITTFKTIKGIVNELKQFQDVAVPDAHIRSFLFASRFDKTDPHIVEPFPK